MVYNDTGFFPYIVYILLFPQCHHMSLMDFVVSPPGCGRSVTDFWGSNAHEAQLRCPDEVDGDIWIWSTRMGLNLSYTKLPRPWSPWESSPSRKNPYGRAGNRTRDLMISNQKLWPLLDHEAGHIVLLAPKRDLWILLHALQVLAGMTSWIHSASVALQFHTQTQLIFIY
jgi:hypothetical protein